MPPHTVVPRRLRRLPLVLAEGEVESAGPQPRGAHQLRGGGVGVDLMEGGVGGGGGGWKLRVSVGVVGARRMVGAGAKGGG